jgi:hypothetical protein
MNYISPDSPIKNLLDVDLFCKACEGKEGQCKNMGGDKEVCDIAIKHRQKLFTLISRIINDFDGILQMAWEEKKVSKATEVEFNTMGDLLNGYTNELRDIMGETIADLDSAVSRLEKRTFKEGIK